MAEVEAGKTVGGIGMGMRKKGNQQRKVNPTHSLISSADEVKSSASHMCFFGKQGKEMTVKLL